jgi:site-specific recombinase XerD
MSHLLLLASPNALMTWFHDEPSGKARLSTRRKATDRPAEAMSPRAVVKVIKKTASRAALPENVKAMVSPHWLRHAHASHALNNGAPISLVQTTLGHGSLKTTSIYTHALKGDSSGLHLKEVKFLCLSLPSIHV